METWNHNFSASLKALKQALDDSDDDERAAAEVPIQSICVHPLA